MPAVNHFDARAATGELHPAGALALTARRQEEQVA